MPTSSKPAIRVEGLSKQYHIGHVFDRRRTLREAVTDALAEPVRRLRRFGRSSDREEDTIWALRDVAFEVMPGEVVGVIGSNGAGKSTLLKILSEITFPTRGQVRLRGRVASLLEVGTGFHPELTGRENIFLNGAILGMTRREILSKFDEIVAFAGVETFVDTPVKRYSSGMQVRLAFAVAAHLEPEILLIDEVLAVGDTAFQKKCMGRIGEVAQSGRTILFVSHNMAAVESLCPRAILLDGGRLAAEGETETVIRKYLTRHVETTGTTDLTNHPSRLPGMKAVARRFLIRDGEGRETDAIDLGAPMCFEIDLNHEVVLTQVAVGIHIYNVMGQRVTTCHTVHQHPGSITVDGPTRVSCVLARCDLVPGSYHVVLGVSSGGDAVDRIDPVASFEVTPRDAFGTGRLPTLREGVVVADGRWSSTAI